MSPDNPIACSLDAEELPRRLAEIRAIGADALLDGGGRDALRFRNDEATRARLEQIVAAESECCAFLGFDLRTTTEALELRITAPEGAEALAHELADAFVEGARPTFR
jgi:hypothetical protein